MNERMSSTVDRSVVGPRIVTEVRPLFSLGIRLFFYATCINVAVLYFVQGGYDIRFGPLHLHASYLRDWLLLCVALALTHAWIGGHQQGIPASIWIQSPLLLFLTAVTLYYINGQASFSYDVLPARLIPVSLLREHDFDLDEFASTFDRMKNPYSIRRIDGHLVSTYPPWGAVLSLPVYLVPVLTGPAQLDDWSLLDLEKRAAVLITALSVVLLQLTLRRITRPHIAWCISAIYAFGTSSFTINSQGMWQHGPSQLFLTMALYCLVRGIESPVFCGWAGLPIGLMIICRPVNAVMAVPIALYVFHKHRDQVVRFLLAGIPSLVLFMSYNARHFGSPLATGFGSSVVGPASFAGSTLSMLSSAPFEGLLGAMISPERGLLFYSPIFLFSLVSIWMIWKTSGYVLLKYLSLAPLLLLMLIVAVGVWPAGSCYGPRMMADAGPLLCVLLYPAFERYAHKPAGAWAIAGLAALSIYMHAAGVYIIPNDDPLLNFRRETLWSWSDSPPVHAGRQALDHLGQFSDRIMHGR